MRLYLIQSEKNTKWVLATNEIEAREIAVGDGIKGHTIQRHVFRVLDRHILKFDNEKGGVISVFDAEKLINAAGYNIDGKSLKEIHDRIR